MVKHIKEGFLAKTLSRSKTGELRKEEGKKITTKLGTQVVIGDLNCDVDKIIKTICNEGGFPWSIYSYQIKELSEFSGEQKKKILSGVSDYNFLLDGKHVICFKHHDELKVKEGESPNEGDYESILKTIVEALKKTNMVVKGRRCWFVLIDKNDSRKIQQRLIRDDEQDYGEYIVDDFKDKLRDKCPESIRLDIMTWNNDTIVINFNYFTLLNYEKILRFTKRFFKI